MTTYDVITAVAKEFEAKAQQSGDPSKIKAAALVCEILGDAYYLLQATERDMELRRQCR
jgi:hypothetical protein